MNGDRLSDETPAHLPEALSDRLKKPFSHFFRIQSAGGATLLFSTAVALALSNSPWADSYSGIWDVQIGFQTGTLNHARSLREWINDGLMTLFFFLVALELKREIVLGELHNPRTAVMAIAAAVGGMLVPAALFSILQWGQPGQQGWGTVMATDTAFVIGCLALLGTRIPHVLRVFMLSLAIVDDIGAILVVAIGYSSPIEWSALAWSAVVIAGIRLMALAGFRSFPPYFLVGSLVWIAVDASGIHPTVTGVILGLMTPARRWVDDRRLYSILSQVVAHASDEEGSGDTKDRDTLKIAEIAARETLSAVERLVMALHPWVSFVIMPLFAFANAGLPFSSAEVGSPIAMAIFFGFSIGKPVGIVLFSWLAVRSGLAVRPPGLDWKWVLGGSMLAGIGFTMALFIANLAFAGDAIDSVKLGIFMASVFSAFSGLAFLMSVSRRP